MPLPQQLGQLYLDQSIMYWVLIPITLTMLCAGIATIYFNQSTSHHSTSTSRHIIKHESVLNVCRRFRSHYLMLTPHVFLTYQTHLFASLSFGISEAAAAQRQKEYEENDDQHDDNSHNETSANTDNNITNNNNTDNSESDSDPDHINTDNNRNTGAKTTENTPLTTTNTEPDDDDIDPNLPNDEILDPTSMINGMFGSIMGILPQMLQFVWITHFFSGYIVAQLPVSFSAPIPTNLKAMFHHSIPPSVSAELPVIYISGVSWYVLNLLGLSGLKAVLMELLSVGSHFSFRSGQTLDDESDIMYQQTVGMSLPRHDAFQQLNPLAVGGNHDGAQFKHDYKIQRDELKLIDYNSDTLVYSQNELLRQWRSRNTKTTVIQDAATKPKID